MFMKIRELLLDKWGEFDIDNGPPGKLSLSAFSKDQADGKIFIYVFKNEDSFPSLIVKARKDNDGFNHFDRQYNNLRYLHSTCALRDFARHAPRPVFCGAASGHFVYSETFFAGEQLKNVTPECLQRKYLYSCVDWLTRLHKATCCRVECTDEELKKNVFLPEPHIAKIKECGLSVGLIEEYIYRALRNRNPKPFTFVFYHGDFTSYNILIKKDNIAIVDWEYSNLKGVPVLDLLNLFAYFGYRKFNGSFYKSFLYAFSKSGDLSKLCKTSISRYNNALNIDASLTGLFMLRFLLELIFLKDKQREDIIKLVDLLLKNSIHLNIGYS